MKKTLKQKIYACRYWHRKRAYIYVTSFLFLFFFFFFFLTVVPTPNGVNCTHLTCERVVSLSKGLEFSSVVCFVVFDAVFVVFDHCLSLEELLLSQHPDISCNSNILQHFPASIQLEVYAMIAAAELQSYEEAR